MSIVAATRTGHGGYCARCDSRISPGDPVFKLADVEQDCCSAAVDDASVWLCEACATDITSDH